MDPLMQYGAMGLLTLVILKLLKPMIDTQVDTLKKAAEAFVEMKTWFAAHEAKDQARHEVLREDIAELRVVQRPPQ